MRDQEKTHKYNCLIKSVMCLTGDMDEWEAEMVINRASHGNIPELWWLQNAIKCRHDKKEIKKP